MWEHQKNSSLNRLFLTLTLVRIQDLSRESPAYEVEGCLVSKVIQENRPISRPSLLLLLHSTKLHIVETSRRCSFIEKCGIPLPNPAFHPSSTRTQHTGQSRTNLGYGWIVWMWKIHRDTTFTEILRSTKRKIGTRCLSKLRLFHRTLSAFNFIVPCGQQLLIDF